MLREAAPADTPEGRAAFRRRLEAAAARIPDRALAAEYRRALLDRFFQARRRPARPARAAQAAAAARPVPYPAQAEAERARTLTAILLRHPDLLRDVEEAYAGLDLPPAQARLRAAILAAWDGPGSLDSTALIDHLHGSGLRREVTEALGDSPFPLPEAAAPGAMPAEAEAGWWHIFGLMHRGGLQQQVAAAQREFAANPNPAAERRLVSLAAAYERAMGGEFGEEEG